MKKLVCESLQELFESPDEISLPNLTYNKFGEPVDNNIFKSPHFESPDAHAFWSDRDGDVVVARAGIVHPPGTKRRGENMFAGRVWADHKLISFWEYPDQETFFKIIKGIESKLKEFYPERRFNLLRDSKWKVEIISEEEAAYDYTGGPVKKNYSVWDQHSDYRTRLIPVKDYISSEQRTELDLGKEHARSPLFKAKHVAQGFGSKDPAYQQKRAWQMASLTSEGVADKYASRLFGIPDEEEEFNKQYLIQKYGKPAAKVKNVPIYKNPKSLDGFDKGVRGIVTENGDLYLAFSQEGPIHQTIINALKSVGVITGKTGGWEDVDNFNEFDFITIQRVWGKEKFAIGESYTLPKPKMDPEGRSKALKLFEPFIIKTRKINSQFEWILEQVRIVARGTLNPTEYEEFKSQGSGA